MSAAKNKKTTTTTTTTTASLRKGQVRILQCLCKASGPMDRKAIAAKAPVDLASCVELIGSPDKATRTANDKKHFPSLIGLGYVEVEHPEEGPAVHSITAKGREALKKGGNQ
jgi:hypothetical protein